MPTTERPSASTLATRVALATFALLTVFAPVAATRAEAGTSNGVQATGGLTPVYAGPTVGRSSEVGSDVAPRAGRAATISVTYSGFTTAAKQAFQAAVDIWEAKLSSNVTIKVQANWTDLGSTGVLGSAGPTTIHRDFTGGKAGTWYPVAIANKLRGADLNGSQPEIVANFNNQFPNWHLGTTGPTPSNQYDLQSVVLHELGHGIGFLVSFSRSGTTIVHGTDGRPWIEDGFATNSSGQKVNRFTSGAASFTTAVTNGNLFWNGNKGKEANGGNRPELYAPDPWQEGSSASHLDEATYGRGNKNSLMTPQIGQGERIVSPGAITLGILEDSGWTSSSK